MNAKEVKKSFIEGNSTFVEIQTTNESATLGGEFQEIDDDDEVWLLQCPKGTNLNVLEGQKLKLPGRSHVHEMEAVAVEFSKPLSESFGYCNRRGKYALKLLPLSGSVVLRNRLKANEMTTADEIEALCPAPGRVPVPTDIKVRHPLLGHQFEEKILMKSSIADRLRQADETSTKIMQEIRSKARKRKNVTAMEKSQQAISIKTEHVESESDDIRPKHKRSKHGQQTISIKSELLESESDDIKSKHKKHKHSHHEASTIEDDAASDSPKMQKKKKSKHASKKDDVSEDLSWLVNL